MYVKGAADPGLGKQYKIIDNIVNVTSVSETYLIQEIQDEKYELLFGDGTFGKKLEEWCCHYSSIYYYFWCCWKWA